MWWQIFSSGRFSVIDRFFGYGKHVETPLFLGKVWNLLWLRDKCLKRLGKWDPKRSINGYGWRRRGTNQCELKSKRSAKTVAGFRVEMGHDSWPAYSWSHMNNLVMQGTEKRPKDTKKDDLGILTQVFNVVHKHRALITIHTFVIFATSFQNYVHLLQCFNSSLPSERSSVPSQSFSASKRSLQNLTCRNLLLQCVPPKTSIARWNVILEANELKYVKSCSCFYRLHE